MLNAKFFEIFNVNVLTIIPKDEVVGCSKTH